MQVPIRVLVVEDHRMFAEAMELLLVSEGDLEIVGSAATASEALEIATDVEPDVVLMDIDLPGDIDGIEATRRIHAVTPHARVVAISGFEHEEVMARALQAGAVGFVPKSRSSDDLVDAVRRAWDGELVLPSTEVTGVFSILRRGSADRLNASRRIAELTPREMEILELLAAGRSTPEIAERLFISPFTVQSHIKRILSKLGVHSKLEAVMFALRNNAIRVAEDEPTLPGARIS